MTIGYVFKAEFFLPENASNFLSFLNDPFDLTTRPIDGFYVRKRRDEDGKKGEYYVLEEPKPTENPAKISENSIKGYDSEANEKFERHEIEAEVVQNETEKSDSDHGDEMEHEMSEADYWNQEDRAEWLKNIHPKQPKNLALARWGIYKNIALLSQR